MVWCPTSFSNATMSPQLIAHLSSVQANVFINQFILVLVFGLTYASRNYSKNLGNQHGSVQSLNVLFLSFFNFCIIKFTCNLICMIEMVFPCSAQLDQNTFNVRVFVKLMIFLSQFCEKLVCLAGVLLAIDCIVKVYFYRRSESYQISQKLSYLWKFSFLLNQGIAVILSILLIPQQSSRLAVQVLFLTEFLYKLFTAFQLILCVAFCVISCRCSKRSNDDLSFGHTREIFQIGFFQSCTLAAFGSIPGLLFFIDIHLFRAAIFTELYSYVWIFFTTHVLLTSGWTVYKLRRSSKLASPNILQAQV
ncbi:hypothetical protein L596_026698 [Steinernema carpocapsae]|uniref:Uncharacterized protein n=1 Tax=Steinernema carpocapsae TaxID=34508 RepID=A0A4U5M246_STECR|nr:hypothetical protein L596_026698 [Steinernema carpocapsae]